MPTPQGTITLDERIPFVRAIFNIVDGKQDHDEAIAIFIEAERKHGVRVILDAATGSRALGLMPIESAFRPTMHDILRLNGDLDQLWSIYRSTTDEEDAQGVRAHLVPFISELWFVVGGTDFANDHLIEYSSGMLNSWTQRAWGGALAEWANTAGWMIAVGEYLRDAAYQNRIQFLAEQSVNWAPGAREQFEARLAASQTDPAWSYIDFCYYLYTFVERYDEWAPTVLRVIQEKCARQMAVEDSNTK